MLDYNQIKPKRVIELDGEPYQVLSAKVYRKQKQKPVNKTKLKHLLTGSVKDYTFQQSDTAEEADVETRDVQYLYNKPARGEQTHEWWFCNPHEPSERFMLEESIIGESASFLRENVVVKALIFNPSKDHGETDNIVGITVPIKMKFRVTEAPPNVKGNTASGGTKPVTLETGAVVNTPMFIETGDTIVVNTETGEYVERA